jgi:VanZ family protein
MMCRAAAWLLTLAVIVLSFVPPSHRVVTYAPHNLEHFAIFFATGVAFGVGYQSRPFVSGIALVIFCGAIELAQNWVPGRHARLTDFIVDAAATCVGVSMASLATRLGPAQSRSATPTDRQ